MENGTPLRRVFLGNDANGVYLQVGERRDEERPHCVAQGNLFEHIFVNNRWVDVCTGKVRVFLRALRPE